MIVVADTSPLNYLILIEEIELLPVFFGSVLLPQAVFLELQHPKTPDKVRQWITQAPSWTKIRSIAATPDPRLLRLDIGEREAIQLALELGADALLIDEAEGREIAESFRIEVRGTLGILERAAKLNMLDLPQALTKLEATSFRISPKVRQTLLKRNREGY